VERIEQLEDGALIAGWQVLNLPEPLEKARGPRPRLVGDGPGAEQLLDADMQRLRQRRCAGYTGSESCFPANLIRFDSLRYFYGRVDSVENAGREWFRTEYTGLGQVGLSRRGYYSYGAPRTSRWEDFWPDALGNVYRRTWASTSEEAVVGGPRDSVEYQATTGRVANQVDYNGSWVPQPMVYDQAGSVRHTAHVRSGSECSGTSTVCFESVSRRYNDVQAYWYDADDRLRFTYRDVPRDQPSREQVSGLEKHWYDAYGRRIQRLWEGQPYYVGGYCCEQDHYLDRYVWDGDQVLYEIRAPADTGLHLEDSDLQAWQRYGRVGYVHGAGMDSPLEAFRADGYFTTSSGRLFLHPDWRGTITLGSLTDGSQDRLPNQLVDWSSQNVTTYGQRMSAFINTNLNFLGSLLSRQVDGAQLQYLRNRYYDPSTGRFTQEDPIGLAGGMNLYGFANGDPVNFSDPFGLCGEKDDQPCPRGFLDRFFGAALDRIGTAFRSINHFIDALPFVGPGTRAASGISPDGEPLSNAQRAGAFALAMADLGGGAISEGLASGIRRAIRGAQGADVSFSRVGQLVRGIWEVPGDKGAGYVRWNRILDAEGNTARLFKDVYGQGGEFLRRDWYVGGPASRVSY
jgi:RHS repeat-associated protein